MPWRAPRHISALFERLRPGSGSGGCCADAPALQMRRRPRARIAVAIPFFLARSSIPLHLHAVAQSRQRLSAWLGHRRAGIMPLVESENPPLLLVAAADEDDRGNASDGGQRSWFDDHRATLRPFLRLVSRAPAPGARTESARRNALAVDVGDLVGVAGEQRLGRAHLGAERQLAFGDAVAPVAALADLFGMVVAVLWTAGAEGAFVHLAAAAEIARLGELRRAEGTGIEAIAAADADVLRVEDDALDGLREGIDRADRHARRIRAMHACRRDRALARLAVVKRDDTSAVDAPGYVMLVLAGGNASVALDAALGVDEEFHSCHGAAPQAFSMRQRVTLVSCMCVTAS